MTYSAVLHIDPRAVIGTPHPHLYGANLEHLGRSVYGGHWAELLKSRKFAGPDRVYLGLSEGLRHQNPNFGIVEPWRAVNPDADRVLFVHDNTTFYTGTQSQRITIRRDDGWAHGIEQGGLPLRAGRAYTLRVVLMGQGQPVLVEIGGQRWTVSAAAAWTTHTWRFTAGQDDDDGTLRLTFSAGGSVWVGCASLMPADHQHGHRADVVAALKEWTPTFIRWPGGNFASAYHWQAGIGDRDRRPSYLDPAWKHWESNDVGTDEFITLCRLVGSEPILTVNMGTGTAEEAAAWVEYCNGGAETRYGALRAANDHPEPFAVKTWFVGNEQFGNWQVGHCDAETYARRYLAFAGAMRAVDATLRLIAVGVPEALYGHWNELVLRAAAPHMDALSVHYYSIRTELWDVPPPAETLYLPKVAAAHEVALMLDKTLALVAQHAQPPVPLAFDEWNTYVAGKAPDFFEDYSMADALYTGALMNACLQRCDRIVMSAIFNLINVMGNYRVTPDAIWKTPSSLVLELFTQYRGGQAVRCAVDTPTMPTPAAGNLPAFESVPKIDAAATFDAQRRLLYVSLVNRDAEQEARITLTGAARKGAAVVYVVAGDSPLALNTESQPRAVTIEQRTWDGGDLVLGAHSFSMLVMELA
ncbi:MAG: hypothetical protein HXY40_00475 [Chloroflexi bacterium]|nr:hypothetical protein [Chloroflexota bacterium]